MNTSSRRAVIAGGSAAAALATFAPLVAAQSPGWPSRPVRIIVPVAAGTATDLTARIFGDKLSTRWRQGVVVEPKPGADGLIALGAFASAHDDHTLIFTFSTAVSLNPLVHAKLPYDPALDLVPVTTTSEVVFAIAVHNSVGAATIGDLKAVAAASPGKLNWAAAPGLPRFVFERHRREQGLDMAYVGYTQTGTAVQDLGEGRIQLMIAALNTLQPVIDAGKVKVLVIASTDRFPTLPNVPSAVDAGFPALAVPAVGCVYASKGFPAAARVSLARDIDAVAMDRAVVDQLAKVGQLVRRSTPADLEALLVRQRTELAPLAEIMAKDK